MCFHCGLVRIPLSRDVCGIFQTAFCQCQFFLGVESIDIQLELFQLRRLICCLGHFQSFLRPLEIEIAGFELGLANIAFAIGLFGELELLVAGSHLSLCCCDTWYSGDGFSARALEESFQVADPPFQLTKPGHQSLALHIVGSLVKATGPAERPALGRQVRACEENGSR